MLFRSSGQVGISIYPSNKASSIDKKQLGRKHCKTIQQQHARIRKRKESDVNETHPHHADSEQRAPHPSGQCRLSIVHRSKLHKWHGWWNMKEKQACRSNVGSPSLRRRSPQGPARAPGQAEAGGPAQTRATARRTVPARAEQPGAGRQAQRQPGWTREGRAPRPTSSRAGRPSRGASS